MILRGGDLLLRKLDLNNNPYIGVFCRANENILLAPSISQEKNLLKIAEALGVDFIPFLIGNCTLIGSLVCMNSKGAVLSNIAQSEDMNKIRGYMDVKILDDSLNALGNNILANDHGAVVNPDYCDDTIDIIQSVLGVKVVRGTAAYLKTIGAAAVATNNGVLCHPHTTDKEKKVLEETLGVPVSIGTLNYGTPMLGACIVVNSKGAVMGTPTTTIEIGRVEEAFKLY